MLEIERKFLVVSSAYKKLAFTKTKIIQGYLNTDPLRTVRVRIVGTKAYLTIKGKSSVSGLSRYEWEKEIAKNEAQELLKLVEDTPIAKWRYQVKTGRHIFEVDEFLNENKGLVIAEIELNSETETFIKPNWLGDEVTGQLKYYNSYISKNPYKQWLL